jgi:hypothetical protein
MKTTIIAALLFAATAPAAHAYKHCKWTKLPTNQLARVPRAGAGFAAHRVVSGDPQPSTRALKVPNRPTRPKWGKNGLEQGTLVHKVTYPGSKPVFYFGQYDAKTKDPRAKVVNELSRMSEGFARINGQRPKLPKVETYVLLGVKKPGPRRKHTWLSLAPIEAFSVEHE